MTYQVGLPLDAAQRLYPPKDEIQRAFRGFDERAAEADGWRTYPPGELYRIRRNCATELEARSWLLR